ncbi:hypothetical protein B0H10DRAFT_955614 [Mycena sp. CBHHK59/15]|nr:hypothetical protein B0H10DRAFT_955614 [Mycena sp. CBHHK59/15]
MDHLEIENFQPSKVQAHPRVLAWQRTWMASEAALTVATTEENDDMVMDEDELAIARYESDPPHVQEEIITHGWVVLENTDYTGRRETNS